MNKKEIKYKYEEKIKLINKLNKSSEEKLVEIAKQSSLMDKKTFSWTDKLLAIILFGYIGYVFIMAIINTICDCI